MGCCFVSLEASRLVGSGHTHNQKVAKVVFFRGKCEFSEAGRRMYEHFRRKEPMPRICRFFLEITGILGLPQRLQKTLGRILQPMRGSFLRHAYSELRIAKKVGFTGEKVDLWNWWVWACFGDFVFLILSWCCADSGGLYQRRIEAGSCRSDYRLSPNWKFIFSWWRSRWKLGLFEVDGF